MIVFGYKIMKSIRWSLTIRHFFAFFLTIVCFSVPVVHSYGFSQYDIPISLLLTNQHSFNPFEINDPERRSQQFEQFSSLPQANLSAQNNLIGVLSGSQTTPPTNVNLPSEGTADWAHWGLTAANTFNHKSGVSPQISNYTVIGSGTPQRYSNNPNLYTWTGGTPSASTTNTPTGVFVTGLNNGFQITVPADTTQKTLKLFVGVWFAGGKLEASLSDGSAANFVDTSVVNSTGTKNALYTLNYQAGTSGQTMTVKWTVASGTGNITLQAASVVDTLDSSVPSVKFTGLRHYLRVSNQIPITVEASDNLGISRVELWLDGILLSTNNVAPNTTSTLVSFNWNTTAAVNGKHMLQTKAYDTAGNVQTANLAVITRNSPTTTLPLPTATFTATPTLVTLGQPTTLSWTTTDAATVTINQGIGSVALNGSQSVTPSATTTYTLTATNATGSVTKTATVTVIPLSGNTITLNPAIRYQTMGGWETVAEAGQLYSPAWDNYKNALFDQAVGDLGLNRVRLEVRSGLENSTDWFTLWRTGQVTQSAYNSKRYEIINDDSNPTTVNPNGFKWNELDNTIDNLVVPLRQRLAARGETLWINANYVDFGGVSGTGDFEHKNSPAEYAEFVVAAYQHMQTKYGFVPNSWEVVLEPDTPGASWSATQVGQAIKAAGDRLIAAGFVPNFVAPSTTSAANAPIYIAQIGLTSGAMQYVGEFSYHRYCCATGTILQSIVDSAILYNKKTAMLEWIGADYQTLHEDLKFGRNSSWQQYTLAFPNEPDNGAQYYLLNDADSKNPRLTIADRSKFLRQYFRYVRSGAERIGAESSNPNFDPLAFINADGKYAVIVKTEVPGTVSIQGLPAGKYGIGYATANEANGFAPDVTIKAEGILSAKIPAAGVLTVFSKN